MKKFMMKFSFFVLCLVTFACTLLFAIAYLIPDEASSAYTTVINRKLRTLRTTPSPKIIMLSGSSSAFGLNQYLLEELTGLPMVNLGLHAGFGTEFVGNLAKASIKKGDLVLIGYEYGGFRPPDYLLIASGFNIIEIPRYLSKPSFTDLIKILPTYALVKLTNLTWGHHTPANPSPYTAEGFDERGQMTAPRNGCTYEDPIPRKQFEKAAMRVEYSDEALAYFNSLGEYAAERGATALMTFPPLFDELTASNAREIALCQSVCEEQLRFPVISHIQDYIFDRRYIFDWRVHCNSAGEEKRTRLLARDINRYLAMKQNTP